MATFGYITTSAGQWSICYAPHILNSGLICFSCNPCGVLALWLPEDHPQQWSKVNQRVDVLFIENAILQRYGFIKKIYFIMWLKTFQFTWYIIIWTLQNLIGNIFFSQIQKIKLLFDNKNGRFFPKYFSNITLGVKSLMPTMKESWMNYYY